MNTLVSSALSMVGVDASHTANEISQQPDLWREIYQLVSDQKEEINSFLDKVLKKTDNIILTGAGTSAYIGISAQGTYQKTFKKITNSVSTTNLVSHPESTFLKDQVTLLVSFARSGNSPESKAAIQLADEICKECNHLIITCNKEGELANITTKNEKYVFNLPERSNDKSLAMTSSFSGMLLVSLLIPRIKEISGLQGTIGQLSHYAQNVLETYSPILNEIAEKPFTRSVFLGSGPLYGVSSESQLKMQELTDGIVVGKHDSFLGLRHGPKAVINESTLVFYHFSNNVHARKYEMDLVRTMKEKSNPLMQIGISEHSIESSHLLDSEIILSKNDYEDLDEDLLAVVSIVPAQVLSFFKSLSLGLSPDNPSRNGAISRVVQGVTIYDRIT